jgi:hypothetical protein
MPYGSGPLIRQALTRATTRQRYVIGAALVACGVALVPIGHVLGGVLAVVGVALLWRVARHRRHPEFETHEPPARRDPS